MKIILQTTGKNNLNKYASYLLCRITSYQKYKNCILILFCNFLILIRSLHLPITNLYLCFCNIIRNIPQYLYERISYLSSSMPYSTIHFSAPPHCPEIPILTLYLSINTIVLSSMAIRNSIPVSKSVLSFVYFSLLK